MAVEPHGPLAGIGGDPQGGHGGQQVDYNHQEDGQQHGAREGARRVVHLAGECGDRVPGKEVGGVPKCQTCLFFHTNASANAALTSSSGSRTSH